MKQFLKNHNKKILLMLLMLSLCVVALGSVDLPFETTLEKIQKSLSGPVARSLAILSVIACGGMMAFGELSGGTQKLLQAVIGLSMVATSAKWVPLFFGFESVSATTMAPIEKQYEGTTKFIEIKTNDIGE